MHQRNNTHEDNAKLLDVVMAMYDLIEYSKNYSKTLGNLWQYHKDVSSYTINSESFMLKADLTGSTPAAGNSKDVN